MRLLLIADGRSPITRNWVNMLQPLGYEIFLVSTFTCAEVPGVRETIHIPVAFSQFSGSQAGSNKKGNPLIARFRGAAAGLRYMLGPWTVNKQARLMKEVVNRLQPDLVHAMRIPYEGMLASQLPEGIPLVISTWGNDLTLHAPATSTMSKLTSQALRRANGLLSDTHRDVKLAAHWGFDSKKPSLVTPGNGGLDLQEMQRVTAGFLHKNPPRVINPRGMRTYVRNDTFFQSIPLVLKKHADVQFLCTSMAGQVEALNWVEKLGIQKNVTLLPMISQTELWQEFARSTLSVSISTHDGTPNTLLEAMALGCLPVCGDLESIREWINPGQNGLLVDAGNAQNLADAICRGLEDAELRKKAAIENLNIVQSRTTTASVRLQVAEFYAKLLKKL